MKTTVRSVLLGALLAALAACATQGVSPADEAWMRAALDAPGVEAPTVDVSTAAAAGPVAPLVLRMIERPIGAPQESKAGTTKADPGKPGSAPWKRFQGDEQWERRDAAGEIAIMERHLTGKKQFYEEGYERRPLGVTAFVQLPFPSSDEATDGLNPDVDWDKLLEDGRGGGFELSYQVVPVFEPLIGVKFNIYNDSRESIRQGAAVIEQKHDGLRSVPFYGGFKLNFPLAMPTEHWFSPSHAGLIHGITPFLKIGVGAAYLQGTELTLTDQATMTSNRFDFVDRGFVGYAEAAIGVEYRAKGGFAVRFSVGIERYVGVDLAGPAKTAFPGTDLEDLDQAILPRLSASFYF